MARTLLTGDTTVKTGVKMNYEGSKSLGATGERLRRPRSGRYLDAIRQLDSGGAVVDAARMAAIRDAIGAEFPDGPASWPLGWVAKCYLGAPYEVHILDLSGQIVRHFKQGEALTGGLERARGLAASGRYATIEVYSDRIVAIAMDGTTSISNT
jgi:hypothetical protein